MDGRSREELHHELVAAQQAARHYKAVADKRHMNGYAQIVSTLGFPIVVALILLGMLTGFVPSPLTTMAVQMEKHAKDDETRTRLMRVLCRHQAMSLHTNPDECDVR